MIIIIWKKRLPSVEQLELRSHSHAYSCHPIEKSLACLCEQHTSITQQVPKNSYQYLKNSGSEFLLKEFLYLERTIYIFNTSICFPNTSQRFTLILPPIKTFYLQISVISTLFAVAVSHLNCSLITSSNCSWTPSGNCLERHFSIHIIK